MIRKRDILEGVKTNGKVVSLRQAEEGPDPIKPDTAKLARLIAAYAPHDGSFDLRIPGLHASRFSRINKECVHALSVSSLCIVAQGAKTVIVGNEVFEYDASRMIVFSVALPVAAQVTRASQSEPYLSLRLDLDPHKIADLVLKVFPHGLPPVQERSAVYLTAVDANMINAATRLMECLAQPGDTELLAPLVMDEILIRLLRSPDWCSRGSNGFCRVQRAPGCEGDFLAARQLLSTHEGRRSGRDGAHECFFFPRALQVRHFDEPPALSKGAAPAGGEASHVVHDDGCGYCESARGLSERFAVQPGIQPLLRECAGQGHRQIASRDWPMGLTSTVIAENAPSAMTSAPRCC